MQTGVENSFTKNLVEKGDVLISRGRYTVRIFYCKMEKKK